MSSENLYDVLNVTRNAQPDEIKKSFRKLAMENHPDKGGNEDKFKKINEAYSVLSDENKRRNYDMTGSIDENNNMGGVDINDILKNVFGMGGGPGFSFSFEQGFGMGDQFQARKPRKECDLIEVGIDINDINYGNTKKVEFEMLDMCNKCNGIGSIDPSNIISCISCEGKGIVLQQLGPFMQRIQCPSCMGKCCIIKNPCSQCKGEKQVFNKKIFELKIPKGISNNHEIKMENKGSYNVQTKQTKDIIFRFIYKIDKPYTIDENSNVTYTMHITIEELLAGFRKNIMLYRDNVTISSEKYFNPNKPILIKDKGLFNIKRQKNGDLYFKFIIDYLDSERLTKYNDVLQKVIYKKNNPFTTNMDADTVISIT